MNKRVNIREIRRRELINATRTVVARDGFEAATISKIAKEAGFSIGFMHHHFSSKDALLAETMRVVYGDMGKLISARLKTEQTPERRLRLILHGNFDTKIYTKANAYIWISYIPRVPFNQLYSRLQKVIERRAQSNLLHELRQIVDDDQAKRIASEAAMLIDGYWLRLGVGSDNRENLRAEALARMDDLINNHVPKP